MPSLVILSKRKEVYFFKSFFDNDQDDFNGHLLASICSFVLFGVGAWRYAQTRKPMPAIPLIVLGGVSLAYQGKKVKEWSH